MSRLRHRVPAGAVLLALAVGATGTVTASPARAAPPSVRAPSAILVEPATGDIVYQRAARRPRAIASTTKLMTALLALEHLSLDDVVAAVPYRAAPAESVINLRAGERLTMRDAMRGLLLASANDVAATLAVRVAGTQARFIDLMNRRARQLGLRQTHYTTPVGLDVAGNRSSASDLVKLTLILRRNRFFRQTTDLPRATLRSGARPRTIVNRNSLVRTVPAVNGVKTGHTTQAGYVLVGSASRRGITVISAVLGDPSEAARNADTLGLLRYGLDRYRVARALAKGQRLASARLDYRSTRVELVAARTVRRTVRRGERLRVRVVDAPERLEGPLDQGARVGTVLVSQRGRVVARVPLVTAAPVAAASAGQRLRHFGSRPATIVLIAAFLAGSLGLLLLRRRALRRRRRPRREAGVA